MKEIWKDVVGYEGYYQVSNLGRVRSLPRTTEVRDVCRINRTPKTEYWSRKGKVLKPVKEAGGYCVRLYKDHRRKSVLLKRVVADAFLHLCTPDTPTNAIRVIDDRKPITSDNLCLVLNR